MSDYEHKPVWDPLIRIWHWVLVIAIVTEWYLGEFMEFSTIQWHFYLGYVILALIAIRIVWGFVGPPPVRFSTLFRSIKNIGPYLKHISRRQPSGVPGHNPLGALSIFAMLAVISAQAGIGLFIESEDFFESGPLAQYIPYDLVGALTHWHHIFAEVLLVIVIIHVSAILFYLFWKRENLIKPMISGMKQVKKK